MLFNKDTTILYARALFSTIDTLRVPNTVKTINQFACIGALSKVVILSDSLDEIQGEAFSNSKIEEIVFNSKKTHFTLSSFNELAFPNCHYIKSIRFGKNVEDFHGGYGEIALGNTNISNIEVDGMNPHLSTDGNILFNKEQTEIIYCAKMKTDQAIIPNSINLIRSRAFFYSPNISSFICHADFPPTASNTCFNIPSISNDTLWVPAGTVEAYRNADGWSSFGSILEIGSTNINNSTDNLAIVIFDQISNNLLIEGISVKEIQIFDINGRCLSVSYDKQIVNLSELKSGIYIVNIIDNNGNRYTNKFIKSE